jgi:hypothetical protein
MVIRILMIFLLYAVIGEAAVTNWTCDPSAVIIPKKAGDTWIVDTSNCKCIMGYSGTGAQCNACIAGTYQAQIGASACQSCAAGTYSTTVGATAASACTTCDANMFASTVGATQCTNCSVCAADQYLQQRCSASADGVCSACTTCGKGNYTFTPCAADADAVCDDDVPVYIVFTTRMNLGITPFLTKPRTYLVTVGTLFLGIPSQDADDRNITEEDWARIPAVKQINAFHGKVFFLPFSSSCVCISYPPPPSCALA